MVIVIRIAFDAANVLAVGGTNESHFLWSNIGIYSNICMKLSQWAKKQGISYTTAYRWFKAGKVQGATQMENGTILVNVVECLSDAELKLKRIWEILNEK
jgi:hypothetical protein